MVPIKTSFEDMQKLLGYLGKQIGWVDVPKVEKALGSQDDRKLGAMVEFGLILRDGANLRTTERGQLFNSDPQAALRQVLESVELYRATLEWVHYGSKTEATAAEVGQYWEASHKDTLGGLKGTTLASGAVTFGRVIDGAGLGTFLVGRGGKETRITFDSTGIDEIVNGDASTPAAEGSELDQSTISAPAEASPTPAAPAVTQTLPAASTQPSVSVTSSPSVHVNVEIHIAADATADTVREIFKNMARYVLDKHVADDGD